MSQMITADLVDLDLAAGTKEEAARSLAERMVALGRVTDLDGFLADVAAREAQMPTGLDGGIGIPHCRSEHVTEPTLAFGRSSHGIDFGAPDGPADLIFLIAAPAGADDAHLTILSALARQLMNEDFTSALRAADDPSSTATLIRGDTPQDAPTTASRTEVAGGDVLGRSPQGVERDHPEEGAVPERSAPEETPQRGTDPEAPAPPAAASQAAPFRIVAVTSCPTGIAHTYMAAEALERAAVHNNVELTVETQGSAGFQRLDPAVIAAADGVIFAHDVPVRDKERFAGKPTVDVGVKAGINRPADLITEVRAKHQRGEVTSPTKGSPVAETGEPGEGYGTKLRKWLMSGVRYLRQDTWGKCRSEPSWMKFWSAGRPNMRPRPQRSPLKNFANWQTASALNCPNDPTTVRPPPRKVGGRSGVTE
ncbi:PTS sugar transporter subunit IIA [Streptomyces sp. ISL-100]|nr:PTS sugar transporter subunit IIA [Streptomyces sp. ISL-100]